MTRILATIGPASDAEDLIEKFSYYDVLYRLNGSHGDLAWHKDTIRKIRRKVKDAFILLDVPGVKPRSGNKKNINIKKGQKVLFGDTDEPVKTLHVPLTKPLPKIDIEEKIFSVNDGQFLFRVVEAGESYVIGESQADFELLPRKGVNFPASVYDEAKQLQIYSDFIEQVYELDIDGLGLSFVQTAELVSKVRALAPNLVMVSKLENTEGLRQCNEIIENSDAIMIDRGDLAAEIGLSGLYDAVLSISEITKSCGKPLIMATENLETMVARDVPSKSEVMSIAHSRSIGADCIMLSEETAIAKNGLHIVDWLSGYLKQLTSPIKTYPKPDRDIKYSEIWDLVKNIRDCPVVLMSKSGYALFEFMAAQSRGEVTVVTNSRKVMAITNLYSNKISVLRAEIEDNMPIETIREVVNQNKLTFFSASKMIAAVYVSKYVKEPRANCITFFHSNDFS
jgi:pyruvate kinase